MVVSRSCTFRKQDGEQCRSAAMQDDEFCFWHSPRHAQEAADARRLGGLRRRRETTVAGAYDFEGLGSVEGIRRLLEIAVLDSLGLENSISRARTLAYLAQVAVKLLEAGELEDRLQALEEAMRPRVRALAGRR